MNTERRRIKCFDCGKDCTYNRSRGNICWKCKELRSIKTTKRTLKEPIRCPTCGKKIIIVPCIACEMGRNQPKSSSSPEKGVQGE